jgi:micrococcal nuclease
MTLGRTVVLQYGGQRIDRWGRQLAHLHDQDGRWLQGALLASGMARVYTFRDNRALAGEMLDAERAARAGGRGIWGDPFFDVRTAAETAGFIYTFQVVEGEVLDAAVVRGRAYLNFGAEWRDDFTVTVAPKDWRAFTQAGFDLEALAGSTVRIRGWLDSYNGPQIVLTHPEQLEIVRP